MGSVTVTKKQTAAVAVSAPTIESTVDQVGALTDQLKAAKAKLEKSPLYAALVQLQTELATAQETLLNLADARLDAEEEADLAGETYQVHVGMKGLKREINTEAAIEQLGDNAVKIAKFNLSDLDDYLTPEQREKCINEERSGARRLSKLGRVG